MRSERSQKIILMLEIVEQFVKTKVILREGKTAQRRENWWHYDILVKNSMRRSQT
jgi:hypothetical protein